MKFKIVTSCTAITEYIVEAPDQETAEEFYHDGNFTDEKITDYQDEQVESIEEITE